MRKILIMLLVVMVSAVYSGTALAGDEWFTDLEAAKKVAAEKKLPILIDFSGSDWCSGCIKLEKEVFSKDEFKTFARDNLVLMVADFPKNKPQSAALKKSNDALAEQYNIEGFPTVLILDAGGKELARTGYVPGGAAAYVEHLKELIAKTGKK